MPFFEIVLNHEKVKTLYSILLFPSFSLLPLSVIKELCPGVKKITANRSNPLDLLPSPYICCNLLCYSQAETEGIACAKQLRKRGEILPPNVPSVCLNERRRETTSREDG